MNDPIFRSSRTGWLPRVCYQYSLCIMAFCILSIPSSSQEMEMPEAPKPDESGYAMVNGLKMYYAVYGEGQPVVLLHGSYMTIDLNWGQLIPVLSKTRKVIAVELQGHGHTEDIDRPLDYTILAGDVAGVMKHLSIESVDVIGYSFGGTVAYAMAIAYPQLVNKLVVVSSVFKYDGWLPEMHAMLASLDSTFLDQTPLKSVYDAIAPDPAHWHAFVAKMLAFDLQKFDLGAERVSKITCPVLLISGDNDGVDLYHLAEAYKLVGGGKFADMTGLPQSQLAILPATTHVGLMMHLEPLLNVLTPFLQL